MEWYMVTKTIHGRKYLYWQKTYRQGGSVKTLNKYIGPGANGPRAMSLKTTIANLPEPHKQLRAQYDAGKMTKTEYLEAITSKTDVSAAPTAATEPANVRTGEPDDDLYGTVPPDLLAIKHFPLTEVRPSFSLNRPISRKKVNSIKERILRTGKVKPLFADDAGLVDGHHRYTALKELGYHDIPIFKYDGHLTAISATERKTLVATYQKDKSRAPVAPLVPPTVSITAPAVPEEAIHQLTPFTERISGNDKRDYERKREKDRRDDERIQYGSLASRVRKHRSKLRTAKKATKGIKSLNPFLAQAMKKK